MASRIRRDYPRKLLVEGETDKKVIPYLMEANGVAWPKSPPVFIEPYGSVDEILKPEVIELEIGGSALEALGVVVDANGDAAARWDGVKTWCGSEFPDLPDQIPAEGLEVVHSDGVRFGVWIMPDNRFTGMLEDFLLQLVPVDSRHLYELARGSVAEAKRNGAPYRDVHGEKGRDSHMARVAGPAGPPIARSGEACGSGSCHTRIETFRRLVQESLSRVEFRRPVNRRGARVHGIEWTM